MSTIDNNQTPGIIQAGDVEFHKLELIDTKDSNKRYNLLGSFVDFTLYEDLFSPILSGYVAIVETQNLLSLLPVTGEEMLYAEFNTPTMVKISGVFHITKVGIRDHQDHKNMYTLEFISYDGYIDINTRLSMAFSGNTGDIIKNTYKKNFGKQLLDADKSGNSIKFVSPYWGPMKIINHATCRATYPSNKITIPNYLFYQTNKGHKFKSLSNLLLQKPKTEYFFDKNPARLTTPDGSSTRDIDREYKSIKELTFVASQDYIKNMMNGAYNHIVFTENLFDRGVTIKTYSFTDSFNSTDHTDKNPLTVLPTTKSAGLYSIHHTYPNLFNGVIDISADILAKRISLLAQLETWKIDIVVNGRSDLEVGDTINVMLPIAKVADQSDIHTTDTVDPIYSGKYLITAIQHRFTMAKYQQNIQCIKDSSFTKIKVS